ncbi:TPA: tetracycline resistance efflux system leader peptide, partial [Staphylococcus aureus]|nr:tetracycline resistance efflux system leader peptide [Enterococcus faecalis]
NRVQLKEGSVSLTL